MVFWQNCKHCYRPILYYSQLCKGGWKEYRGNINTLISPFVEILLILLPTKSKMTQSKYPLLFALGSLQFWGGGGGQSNAKSLDDSVLGYHSLCLVRAVLP